MDILEHLWSRVTLSKIMNFVRACRYRMRRPVFIRLMESVTAQDDWFVCREDCTRKMGLSPLQKCLAAIRILAYGLPADAVDEYVRISESSATVALNKFCRAVVAVFEDQYLRAPTSEDVHALQQVNAPRGFPGMLGSLDCMHWEWRNCPTGWAGQFTGRSHTPTMILEAVASHDLWIWHAYFGMPGSSNDINVLHRSPLFRRQLRGVAPHVPYTVNGNTYNMGYYLADGIYPNWPAFIKSIRQPMTNKARKFAQVQEGAQKDIERAFGVLQAKWAVIRGPAYGWTRTNLGYIMKACIIMHNMIIEDERGEELGSYTSNGPNVEPYQGWTYDKDAFITAHHNLRDSEGYHQLMRDHIEHVWSMFGRE
jgi:hypothetical protein